MTKSSKSAPASSAKVEGSTLAAKLAAGKATLASIKERLGTGRIPVPAAKSVPAKAATEKVTKLPIPARKVAAPARPADADVDGVPAFLDRTKNGVKPLAVVPAAKAPAAPAKSVEIEKRPASAAKSETELAMEARRAKAAPVASVPLTGKAALRAIAAGSTVPVTKVPAGLTGAKAAELPAVKGKGKASAEAISAEARKGTPSKAPKAPAAKAPKAKKSSGVEVRPDGLRVGSKSAMMLDLALAAGKAGITEEAICKKLGWKHCAVTLRRVCDRVNVTLTRKDGVFYASK